MLARHVANEALQVRGHTSAFEMLRARLHCPVYSLLACLVKLQRVLQMRLALLKPNCVRRLLLLLLL